MPTRSSSSRCTARTSPGSWRTGRSRSPTIRSSSGSRRRARAAPGPTPSWTEVRGSRPGSSAKGVAEGDKVLIHSENCPEMVLSWYACATLGAVGGHHQHEERRAPRSSTSPSTAGAASPPSPSRSSPTLVAEAAPRPALDRRHRRQQRRRPRPTTSSATGSSRFAALAGDADRCPARPAEPMLPVGIMFTSGTTVAPEGRRAHARQRALGEPRRAPQHRHAAPTTSTSSTCRSSTSTRRAGRCGRRSASAAPSCCSRSSRRAGSGRWSSSTA